MVAVFVAGQWEEQTMRNTAPPPTTTDGRFQTVLAVGDLTHRLDARSPPRAQTTGSKSSGTAEMRRAFRALSTAVGTAADGRKSASPLERDDGAVAFRRGISGVGA